MTPFPFQYALLTAVILQSMALHAQDTTEYQQLPVIKVQAVRTDSELLQTPATIQKIQVPQMQENTNVNLSELLQGVVGLQINNRENYAQDLQISMRGFGARSTFGVRGIRLYVDGIPATMPDGQGQSSNIDLDSLDNIEVLTGPFSSIYGNSSGGTILIETREGQGKDSIQVGLNAGSHHKQQANIQVQGGSDQAHQPAYVISSSYFDTDGFRDHSAAKKVLNNAKLTWNLEDGSKINWLMNRTKIEADDPQGLNRAQWQANPKQVNDSQNIYDVRKEIEQTQTGLIWNKPLNDQQELYGMVYFGNRQVVQYQSISSSAQKNPRHAGGMIDFNRDYYGADFRWTGKELLPNTTFIAGLAFDQMREDRQGYENFDATGRYGLKGESRRNEINTLWNLDPYVQASWQFLPQWHLDAGLRYSNVNYESADHYITTGNGDDSGSIDYQKLLPTVALGWEILPELYAYTSYGKGFETPTFTEMAYPTVGTSGINFNLKPATSDTTELGLKSQNSLGLFTFAVFHTETKNDIVPDDANGGRSTFRNAERTLRKGLELSWQKQLWQALNVRTSYSYLDATFDADIPATTTKPLIQKGTYIPGIAKNQAFVGLAWQPGQGFHAGLEARYMDKIYVDDINSDTAPSYTVVAANVGYLWVNKDWKVNTYARVDNLFDRNYIGSVIVNDSNSRFFEPADRRNFNVGLLIKKVF
ncbi:TonB-dependent receptor [Acinetobacter sp. C_4_1]|uniref:TonB-dependent receptor n=1 Tax=unclassified Acinetobacter TaxID=196816 RepID=UPI0021B7B16C|nr:MULTISPECIES: TonB-dependent receptor [unclassified Acinetobacter]MCT8088251.1 TonB-dependent receptor [Acinetobacter sp. F_3_1]MCT8097620.1 TonB-dependent receptor [Acinetobacter sp. C_3_1]MCT8100713.1 TonB-dependent receptor [Acinetobacter sp. C_4_1]MCT8134000.1 TonB-dependent receptor [Acinetobacter sp. T_3_1]